MTILQVDDSVGFGDEQFLELEEKHSTVFKAKPRSILSSDNSLNFNGGSINLLDSGSLYLQQEEELSNLMRPTTPELASSIRAKIQYIGSVCRPDLCGPSQILTGKVDFIPELEDLVQYCTKSSGIGLKFVPLDMNSVKLILFTDADFANREDLTSQIGFVILLVDASGNCNIVHYGS